MVVDKIYPFASTVFRVLETTLPFQYCPALETVLGKLAENTAEIYLSIAEGAKTSGAVYPALVNTVNALATIIITLVGLGVVVSGWIMYRQEQRTTKETQQRSAN